MTMKTTQHKETVAAHPVSTVTSVVWVLVSWLIAGTSGISSGTSSSRVIYGVSF